MLAQRDKFQSNRLDPLPLLSDLPVDAWDDARKSLNCIEHSKAAIVHGVKILKKCRGGSKRLRFKPSDFEQD